MKIRISNMEKLQAALDKAQAAAKARKVTAQDIVDVLNGIKIPKSKLPGTEVHWDGAEHFPAAYKYIPHSTHWTAVNIGGNWYITDICRDICPNRKTFRGRINYSPAAREWIVENASLI